MGELNPELSPESERTRERLAEVFAARVDFPLPSRGMLAVQVAPADLRELLVFLREDADLSYRFLTDITAVDHLPQEPRFEVVYHLLSLQTGARVRVKVRAAEGHGVPSVTGLWSGANFMEREAFDMFGIPFPGHPNLQRILTPEGFVGHPLRRDFDIGSEPVDFDLPYRRQFSDATN